MAVKQLALLASRLIPDGSSGYASRRLWRSVLKQLEEWHWRYVLRQQPNCCCKRWQRLDTLLSQVGQQLWLPQAQLTHKYRHTVNAWLIGNQVRSNLGS